VTEVLARHGAGTPGSVRDAVLGRAARLSAPARGLLEAVAVVATARGDLAAGADRGGRAARARSVPGVRHAARRGRRRRLPPRDRARDDRGRALARPASRPASRGAERPRRPRRAGAARAPRRGGRRQRRRARALPGGGRARGSARRPPRGRRPLHRRARARGRPRAVRARGAARAAGPGVLPERRGAGCRRRRDPRARDLCGDGGPPARGRCPPPARDARLVPGRRPAREGGERHRHRDASSAWRPVGSWRRPTAAARRGA
jgi:hypothetical protein